MRWQEKRSVLALDQIGTMSREQICRRMMEISGSGNHVIIGWPWQAGSCSSGRLRLPELRLTWLCLVAVFGIPTPIEALKLQCKVLVEEESLAEWSLPTLLKVLKLQCKLAQTGGVERGLIHLMMHRQESESGNGVAG